MKPVVLICFKLKNGERVNLYFGVEEFSKLRQGVGSAMRKVFGIELRTL